MLDQLKLLENLQRVDLQLQETEQALAALPAKIQSMKEDVSNVEALLEQEWQQLKEVQTYRAELDLAIKNDQATLNKTKSKLTQIRTSKEYMAVQREFETNRRIISEREQEVDKLNQAIEQTSASIARHEEEVQELQKHVTEEEAESRGQVVELEQKATGQRLTREQTTEQIGKSLLRKYDQIRRLRGGVAVVAAVEGVCTGCRMHLPPQLYNMLQRFETIEQCPNCQRIVYYRNNAASEVTEATAPAHA